MEQTTDNGSILERVDDTDSCSCNKKQCMLGIASITIGVGGFLLASLL